MRIFFLFIILITSLSGYSQDTAFYFSGKVYAISNGKEIPFASVKVQGSFRKTFCDAGGNFSILVNKKGDVLEICADGFENYYLSFPLCLNPDKKIYLKSIDKLQDNLPAAWQKIFRNGKWIVLDYNFYKNNILLIALNKNTGTNSVILTDSTGNLKYITMFEESISSIHTGPQDEIYLIGNENVYLTQIDKNEILVKNTVNYLSFQKKFFATPYADSSGTYVRYESKSDLYLNTDVKFMARKKYSTWYVRLTKNNRLSLFKNFSDEKFLKAQGKWKLATELGMSEYSHSIGSVYYPGSPFEFIKWKQQLIVVDLFNYRVETFDNVGKYIAGHDFYTSKDYFSFKKILFDTFDQELYFFGLTEIDASQPISNEYFKKIDPYTGRITNVKLPEKEHLHSMKIYNGYEYFIEQDGNERFLVRTKL